MQVGKDLAAMDSNDFDVDDTASYGAACEATLVKAAVAPAAGKT